MYKQVGIKMLKLLFILNNLMYVRVHKMGSIQLIKSNHFSFTE